MLCLLVTTNNHSLSPRQREGLSWSSPRLLLKWGKAASASCRTSCKLKALKVTGKTPTNGTGLAASDNYIDCNTQPVLYNVALGQYGFEAYAVDNAGNYGQSSTYYVQVATATGATSSALAVNLHLLTVMLCMLPAVMALLL